MAFLSRIGNIVLDNEYYLIGNPTANTPIIGDSFGFNWNTVPWGDTMQDKYKHLRGRGFALTPSNGGGALIVPLKGMLSDDRTTFETYFSDYTENATYKLANLYIKPNIPLQLLGGNTGVPYYEWLTPWHTRGYMLGVPVYSNNSRETLTAVYLPLAYLTDDNPPEEHGGRGGFCTVNINYFKNHGFNVIITKSDDDFGEESQPDGYGQDGEKPAFDHSSDIIGVPNMPSVSTSSVGFIHLYSVTQNSLAGLSDYLFPDVMKDLADIVAQLPVALADLPNVLVPILRAFASIFAYRDSVQYIIDLHAIPVPPSVGASDYIKVGALSTDITAGVITSDYVDIDCGALSIRENFKNFLDYMVSCKLFLPFVGFIDIKPELWNGGTISVKYRFNVIDGSFMAFVSSTSGKSNLTNTVVGQYGGSACLHLPMVAAEYGAIIGGIVQGAMAVDKAGGASSASQMASAEAGLASALMNFNLNVPMQQSNGYNASASYMGGRTPYLMIEYPVPQFSSTYTHEKGLPLNVNVAFSSLHGYTEIDAGVDLSGIQAPVDIIDEIRNALVSGTIF